MMYRKGQGFKQDYQKAMECFLISADKGNPKGQNAVGIQSLYSVNNSNRFNRGIVSYRTRGQTRLPKSNGILHQICQPREPRCAIKH